MPDATVGGESPPPGVQRVKVSLFPGAKGTAGGTPSARLSGCSTSAHDGQRTVTVVVDGISGLAFDQPADSAAASSRRGASNALRR